MSEFKTISKENKRWGFKIKHVTFAGVSYFVFTNVSPINRSQGLDESVKLDRFEGKSVANWNQAKINTELKKVKSQSVRIMVSKLPVQVQTSIKDQMKHQMQSGSKNQKGGCIVQ